MQLVILGFCTRWDKTLSRIMGKHFNGTKNLPKKVILLAEKGNATAQKRLKELEDE